MEQAFWNLLRRMRCTWTVDRSRHGPAHASVSKTVVVVRRGAESWCATGVAPRDKDALRQSIRELHLQIEHIPDPCDTTVAYEELWNRVGKELCLFKAPPPSWFATPQVLGVDWEGQPRSIVQISCEMGVYIDHCSSPAAHLVLSDRRHTHCVFGAHEVHLVSNPMNLQPDTTTSLVECASLEFSPRVRFVKDKTMLVETDWTSPGERALRYAALDAEVTRRLGKRQIEKRRLRL